MFWFVVAMQVNLVFYTKCVLLLRKIIVVQYLSVILSNWVYFKYIFSTIIFSSN